MSASVAKPNTPPQSKKKHKSAAKKLAPQGFATPEKKISTRLRQGSIFPSALVCLIFWQRGRGVLFAFGVSFLGSLCRLPFLFGIRLN